MAAVGLGKHAFKRSVSLAPKVLILAILSALMWSCAYKNNLLEIKKEIQIPQAALEPVKAAPVPVKTPDFVPVREELSPLRTKIVDVAARNTPLRDVLYVITEATGLNLVMDKDVNSEIPITLNLKNVTAEDALNKIFASVDYFHAVRENVLYVKATETRIFELGHPPVVQSYSTDLGGDILGAAVNGKSGGDSSLKGSIVQKTESDKNAYNFWDVIEKSLEKITGTAEGATAGQFFSVNRMTGTIFVTGTRKALDKVETYVRTLKQVLGRQVLIEAKVVEVTLSDGLQFGIDWNSVLNGDNRRTAFTTSNFASVASPTVSSPVFVASSVASDLTAILRAIQTQGEIRLLSNPRVNITNGQTAILGVGTNTAYISKVETTQTAATGSLSAVTFTVETGSILSGIMIGIVPYVSESGEISMSVTPIVSDLVKLESQTLGGNNNSGNSPSFIIQLPQIDLRQMTTTVKVQSGQTVVIGGLIQKREVLQDSQVPVLGDIPLLGYLFKSRNKAVRNFELIVLLKPVLVSKEN